MINERMIIEKTILKYLWNKLDVDVTVDKRDMEPPFVAVERTGGNMTDFINRSSIAFQSYGNSLLEAAELNERVKEVIQDLPTLNEISGVSLVSDYNFSDTKTKQYRYQAVFDVWY